MRPTQPIVAVAVAAAAAFGGACGMGRDTAHKSTDGIAWPAMDPADKHFPDVIAAELRPVGRGRFDVVVSLSSPYDTRFRYANGWRIGTAAGDWIGERRFRRHHADEQPWTRILRGLHIPFDVRGVVIEGHDVRYGYGGRAFFLRVPPS